MKKKIIIGIFILIVLVTLIAIPKTTYQKWFGKTPSDVGKEKTEYQRIFLVNEKNKLVGVKVYVDQIKKNQILQKWNLLTKNVSVLPEGYSSSITPSTALEKYELDGHTLVMYVSEDILRSAGKLAVDALAWTFCDDEIDKIVLMLDGKPVTTINDYSFTKISKATGTNYVYETSYLLESDYTTVIYQENDTIFPVTYFYQSKNECEYVIQKILAKSNLETLAFTYEQTETAIQISFTDLTNLDTTLKETIEQTIGFNFNVDTLTINGKDTTLYEKTFAEVKN